MGRVAYLTSAPLFCTVEHMTTSYTEPLTKEDLQAWVDYTEQMGQMLMASGFQLIRNQLPPFPVTAVERARWEIRRRGETV